MSTTRDYLSDLDLPQGRRAPLRPTEFRFRKRTTAPSYGLLFSLTIFVLLASFSTLSAGQNCTPVFEGSEIGVLTPQESRSVIKVVEGTSFNLSCTLSQLNVFAWRLNKSSTPLHDLNHFKIKSPIREGGVVLTELHVTNVTRNHAGEYTCIGSGCQSSSDDAHHGLTVKVIYAEQPKIIHPKRDNYSEVVADVGKDLQIRCESKEDVHEGVIWQREIRHETSSKWESMESICKKKNATVSAKKQSHCYIEETFENKTKILTLFLNDVRQEDMGNYSCGIPIPSGAASSEIEMQKNDFISLRAGRSKQSRVKRSSGHGGYQRPPPKYEGIYPRASEQQPVPGFGPDNEKLKIIRRFDKGMNSTIAMEGDPVVIFCNLVRGNQTSPTKQFQYQVAWRFPNDTYYSGDQLKNLAKSGYYNYSEDAHTTAITILSANASDKGWYQCSLWDSHAQTEAGERGKFSHENIIVTFEIRLRIREKMTPLYPFISICVEILIVFLIILIYEKSKSKTEVDESDTDGSPDQKNVSDNGDGGGSEATRLAGKE